MNIIITGGHSGIGLELTKRLLAEGKTVGLIVRDISKAQELLGGLEYFSRITFWQADLSKQSDIIAVAQAISSQWSSIDALFNNAGVLLDAVYTSPQGNEMHYEVNTLAPYLLTQALKPLLEAASKPVVVNTVTDGLDKHQSLPVNELLKPTKFRKLFGSYMHSKLALVLLMNDLAKEWQHIRVINVTPGPNKTPMTAGNGMPTWLQPIRNLFFAKPNKGADLLYRAAFEAQHSTKTALYLQNNSTKHIKLSLKPSEKELLLSGINYSEIMLS
jgi:NAD(P)-dependent dehydrogenase (short-subunit alcohol dehydrogenase family)